MSRLKPLVRERFKSKSARYNAVAIAYSGHNLYSIIGIAKDGHCEYIREISEQLPLKLAREAIWDYAEIKDGLPVLDRR